MTEQEPPGEVHGANVSDSQGILIGSGNQYNSWAQRPPLDPAALSGLNPHIAVARLQQLSHDELVDFFIRASPDSVSEILEVFLDTDEARAVATLGDLNRRKAAELISTVSQGKDDPLNELPEAAHEIARKAALQRWADAGPLKLLGGSYVRRYKTGHVHWSPKSGARTTTGAIDGYWLGHTRDLHVAISDQGTAAHSPFGTKGVWQSFSSGAVYSSAHGIFNVINSQRYAEEGSTGGWLGFPVGESERIRRFRRLQRFEGGIICSYFEERQEKIFTVRHELSVALPDARWRPISDETDVVSTYGTEGTVQCFEVMEEEEVTGADSLMAGPPYQTAIFTAEPHGPVPIAQEAWGYYSRLGAARSSLGFPSGQATLLLFPGMGGFQEFEGGRIYWRSGADSFAVSSEVVDFITSDGSSEALLGFPLTDEAAVSTGESDSIQFFENGVVTRRNGTYEVWLR